MQLQARGPCDEDGVRYCRGPRNGSDVMLAMEELHLRMKELLEDLTDPLNAIVGRGGGPME